VVLVFLLIYAKRWYIKDESRGELRAPSMLQVDFKIKDAGSADVAIRYPTQGG
jgi:hypothetical protein